MDRTILVTGSSRGVGKAIAELAHKQGYKVIVHGRTDSAELRNVHAALKGSVKVYFDVADKAATHEAIAKLGPIDVLVNNAGVARNFLKGVADVDDDKALEEYRTNVLGTLHCIQAVLPAMSGRSDCSVINIASIKGQYNLATLSTLTYATTKAGIIALTKALAKAYPAVRFNSVSPGYVETDQAANWNDETYSRISNGTVLGRIAKPEEIAPLVIFLASSGGSYITGADYSVDGGYAIKGK